MLKENEGTLHYRFAQFQVKILRVHMHIRQRKATIQSSLTRFRHSRPEEL